MNQQPVVKDCNTPHEIDCNTPHEINSNTRHEINSNNPHEIGSDIPVQYETDYNSPTQHETGSSSPIQYETGTSNPIRHDHLNETNMNDPTRHEIHNTNTHTHIHTKPIQHEKPSNTLANEKNDSRHNNEEYSIRHHENYDEDDEEEEGEDSDFDWDDSHPDEEIMQEESNCCLCLTRSSSKLSWICFSVMAAISVGICIAVFITVKPQTDPTMTSYNLALWFTFIAFMFCVALATQMVIEIIPWIIRHIVAIVMPMKTEVTRTKLAYYNDLRSYTKLVVIGAWLWGSWAFLRIELDLPEGATRPGYVDILETVWEIIFLATLFLFIEKFILQIIATTFHKKAYGDRLSKNQRALRILDKLKRSKGFTGGEFLLKRIYKRKQDNRTVKFQNEDTTTIPIPDTSHANSENKNDLAKNNRQGFLDNVSKQLRNQDQSDEAQKITRSNTSISSITTDENKSSFLFSSYRKLLKESAFQDPVKQAKHLARRIFYNVVGSQPTRQYVIESDFLPFFRTTEDAKEAFELFDADDNGEISRREMRTGCIRIYRDRLDIARSMRDMSQATGKLDILLIIIFLCIWIVVSLAVFGVNVGSQLTPLWSAFIAASFIFGNSAKNAFESIIFVFVTHPFDTGDRIMIDQDDWIVSNVGLMVSTFINLNGSVVYARNSILSAKSIINCRRTGKTSEKFGLQVSYYTPTWKLQILRDHMIEWNNKYPKLYTKDACGVNIISFEKLDYITLTFFFQHTKNWQDAAGRWLRHNNFLLELKDEMTRLNIVYKRTEQPIVYRYYGEEPLHDPDDDVREREFWGNTSKIQNQAAANEQVGIPSLGGVISGGSNNTGGDVGAAAGAAATVAFTTGGEF